MIKRRLGLTVIIGGFFSGFFALFITVLCVVFYSYFTNSVKSSLLSEIDLTIENNSADVRDLFSRVTLFSQLTMESDDVVLDTLLSYDGNLFESLPAYQRMKRHLEANMSLTFGRLPIDCTACFIVDDSMPMAAIFPDTSKSGIMQLRYKSAVLMSSKNSYMGEEWYQSAIASAEPIWFANVENPRALYMIQSLRQTVYDSERKQLTHHAIGAIIVGFDTALIEQRLRTPILSEGALTLLSDANGGVLYSNGPAGESANALSLLRDKPGRAYTTVGGAGYYTWQNNLAANIQMLTLVPAEDLEKISRGAVSVILLSAVLLMAAGLPLVIGLSRVIAHPIKRLSMHISSGNANAALAPIQMSGLPSEEVRVLYEQFNEQMARIKRLIEDMRIAGQEKQMEQIRTMQAQINPHFVYNVLDTVCCKLLLAGEDETAKVLSDLAGMMRYNIKNPDEQVSLATELSIVNLYMRIHKTRNPDPVELTMDIEDDAASCMVYKMTVQPLVENALTHAAGYPEIKIIARIEDEKLIIRVIDGGRDVNVEQINAHISGKYTIPTRSTGLGTRNIDSRIRMSYGDEYGVRFAYGPENATMAVVTMPAIRPLPI